jgi:hypothetical protein
MCVPVQTLPFIRQVVHSTFNSPDVSLHGPNAQASYMEIVFISLTVRTSAFMVWTLGQHRSDAAQFRKEF